MRIRDHPLHVASFALLALAVLALSACAPATTPEPTDTIACTEDAFMCPDGSWVGRTGPDCEFVCPEPSEELPAPGTGSTFQEYKSQDPEQCMVMRFTCDGDEMFSDETGCGCVRAHNEAAVTLCTADYNPVCGWFGQDIQCLTYPCAETKGNLCMASIDPKVAYTTPGECPAPGSEPNLEGTPDGSGRLYVSRDQTQCAATTWICTEGKQQFYDETGCGCESADAAGGASGEASGSTLVTECTEPRPEFCTMDYRPVCATRADGTYYTAGNACGACGDAAVVSHTPGECTGDGYSEEDLNPEEAEGKLQAIDCPAERPEACTREYMPVCGQKADGTSDTYGNDCTACADAAVQSYTEGACA